MEEWVKHYIETRRKDGKSDEAIKAKAEERLEQTKKSLARLESHAEQGGNVKTSIEHYKLGVTRLEAVIAAL